MKKKLNISIDEELMKKVKIYATKNKLSLTKLVEDYLLEVTKNITKKELKELEQKTYPTPSQNLDEIKESYFQYQAKKYGFKI